MFLNSTSRSSGSLHPELGLHFVSASDKNIDGLKSIITAKGYAARHLAAPDRGGGSGCNFPLGSGGASPSMKAAWLALLGSSPGQRQGGAG